MKISRAVSELKTYCSKQRKKRDFKGELNIIDQTKTSNIVYPLLLLLCNDGVYMAEFFRKRDKFDALFQKDKQDEFVFFYRYFSHS